MLDKYRVSQIIALLNEGHGIKTVARMTGVSRNTVRRFQRNIPRKGHHGRAWRAMEAKLEDIRKLFYDCRGNCSAMLRFVEDAISVEPPGLRTLQKFCTPFRLELLQSRLTKTERFETPPGHQMQIDFGEGDVCVGGETVRVHFFVARMSYSRRIFAKSYFSENQVNWLDGIESAFRFFNGVPREIVCDNAKALVKDHYAPENERFAARFDWFCQYHGVHPIATSVRKPNSKGKVESAVRYIKHNALVNGRFKDLEALNCHLERWSLSVCDQHNINDPFLRGPKTPAERWLIEKPALRPNRKPPIAMARYEERAADKNGLIRVDNAMYRVPDGFARRDVQLVVVGDTITVRCGGQSVILDKAKDIVTAKEGKWSNPLSKEKNFKKKIKEFKKDKLWKRMQNPQCQRNPGPYDAAFRTGA